MGQSLILMRVIPLGSQQSQNPRIIFSFPVFCHMGSAMPRPLKDAICSFLSLLVVGTDRDHNILSIVVKLSIACISLHVLSCRHFGKTKLCKRDPWFCGCLNSFEFGCWAQRLYALLTGRFKTASNGCLSTPGLRRRLLWTGPSPASLTSASWSWRSSPGRITGRITRRRAAEGPSRQLPPDIPSSRCARRFSRALHEATSFVFLFDV